MEKATKTPEELGLPSNVEEVQYDLVQALLEAGNYGNAEEEQKLVRIERNGKFMFEFTVHPISEDDVRIARHKSTTFMKNPNGKNLPPIEKETDFSKLRSWKIYLATVEEDQKKIWGNPALKEAFNIIEPWEAVDKLLKGGEKSAVDDLINSISGYDIDLTDYAKTNRGKLPCHMPTLYMAMAREVSLLVYAKIGG